MAYFSLHAYDADVWLREFRGLNQADVMMNPDVRFAGEEKNLETPHGVLQPQAAMELFAGSFEDRVETLAVLHRRLYTGPGSRNWYVCASGGKIYQKQEGGGDWQEVELPEGVDAFACNVWSWVTYEYESGGDSVDVLLISNAQDGMYMIIPPDTQTTWNILKSSTWGSVKDDTWGETLSAQWTIIAVDTRTNPNDDDEPQKKFGVIERYAERIWGTGVPGNPDSLYYSQTYDPTNWTPDAVIPEDGAGEIKQPSWDGDEFHALKRFGDQLLAFKKNRIWRVLGVSPGEYTFQEQFGGGTEYFNTIAVYSERVFMACKNGLEVYDGMTTSPYAKEQVEQIWKTVNQDALDQMCAVVFQNRFYWAFPVGDSAVNNAMLVYDMTESNILYYTDIHIESFLPADDRLLATSSSLPGKILTILRDSWTTGKASGAATKWVTPWMDFGYKRIVKGGFDLYFLPEVQNDPVTITISVQTEKKAKTKNYIVQPLTQSERELGKSHKMKRLHFGGSGRKFRVIIETAAGVTAPWRIIGGIQMVVETDPD